MGVLIGSVLVAALAGLLFGFDTAVIAGVTGDLTRAMDLTPATRASPPRPLYEAPCWAR